MLRRPSVLRIFFGSLPVFGCLVASCTRGATEIIIVTTTDLDCAEITETTASVGTPAVVDGKPPASTSIACVDGRVGRLVITPAGDDTDEIGVRLATTIRPEACARRGLGSACTIVARRALRFIPHESLRVQVVMRASCINVDCTGPILATCVRGACVAATVADQSRCTGDGCDESALGAVIPGGPPDAGPIEAAPPIDATPVDTGPGDASVCPSGRGATMLRVTTPAGGFCIDTTEVSRAHYAAFLASMPDAGPAAQPAECAFNTSFLPAHDWPPGVGENNRPVVGVDWCDARAFCAWAGKRLCGSVGRVPLTSAEIAIPTKTEWAFACTRGGARTFPYGSVYDADACNLADTGLGSVVDVGTRATCQGGFDGLFDMSGNVHEWLDLCEAGDCRLAASSFSHAASDAPCDRIDLVVRSYQDVDAGIRCCAD